MSRDALGQDEGEQGPGADAVTSRHYALPRGSYGR